MDFRRTFSSRRRKPSLNRHAGFTLVEAMCSLSVLGLLSLGVMAMYVAELQLESRTQADATTGAAGADGLRQIAECTREGLYYLLPQETLSGNSVSFTTSLGTVASSGNVANPTNPASRFGNYTTANFINSTTTATCYTGMFLACPPQLSPISVVTSTGAAPVTPVQPYNLAGTSTTFVMFFRSDSNGNPQPATGTYLWETGTVNGATVDQAVMKSLDGTAWNALEFDRPVNPVTGTVIWNEVQVKIVANAYSAQTGKASHGLNDDTTVGRTILLRDFDPSGKSNLNSNTPINAVGSRFQAD